LYVYNVCVWQLADAKCDTDTCVHIISMCIEVPACRPKLGPCLNTFELAAHVASESMLRWYEGVGGS
jgi:hypothetical protein